LDDEQHQGWNSSFTRHAAPKTIFENLAHAALKKRPWSEKTIRARAVVVIHRLFPSRKARISMVVHDKSGEARCSSATQVTFGGLKQRLVKREVDQKPLAILSSVLFIADRRWW
jgi:hypothetical protein